MLKLKPGRLAIPLVLTLLVISLATVAQASVDLAYFRGAWQGNGVSIQWGTGSERDNAGFHIWRSETNIPITGDTIDRAQATRLTNSIIGSPTGACNPLGANDYTFSDTTASPSQQTYYYYLESLNCQGGGSTFYGSGDSGLRVERGTAAPPATATTAPVATQTPPTAATPVPAATRTPTQAPGNAPAPTSTSTPVQPAATQPSAATPFATVTSAPNTGVAATPTSILPSNTSPLITPPPAPVTGAQPIATRPSGFAQLPPVNTPIGSTTSPAPVAAAPSTGSTTSPAPLAAAPSTGSTAPAIPAPLPASPSLGTSTNPSGVTSASPASQAWPQATSPFVEPGQSFDAEVLSLQENELEFEDFRSDGVGAPATEPFAAPAQTLALGDIAPQAGQDPVPGAMSAPAPAATPTVLSVLAQQPPAPRAELIAAEVDVGQGDAIDRMIQGLIGLILLAVVALLGFLGWTYVTQ
jgi:hypothetical protein